MKILCICYEDIREYGGSNRQVIEITSNLQKLGNTVKLSTPLINRLEDAQIEVEYIPVINLPFFRYLSYLIVSPFYLMKTFLKFKPDVVFLFQIYLDLGTLLICRLFRRPLVFYINGIAREELKLVKVPGFIIYIVEFIQKQYAKLSDKIFTITDAVKEQIHLIHNIPLDKIELLKNAVDIEEFKPIEKDWAREKLGFDRDLNLIGFVSKLFPWHGADYLINSVPLVLKEIPDAKFIIVGQGRMMKKLFKQVKSLEVEEAVIFTGSVPFKRVPFYINVFDVCVVFFKPVRVNQGDPIKLYEYLACSKPVVASNVRGYGDFVEKIGAGVSVESNNPKAVAEAIVKLIKNENLRKNMGNKGRVAVIKGYTWQARAQQIEKCFNEILS